MFRQLDLNRRQVLPAGRDLGHTTHQGRPRGHGNNLSVRKVVVPPAAAHHCGTSTRTSATALEPFSLSEVIGFAVLKTLLPERCASQRKNLWKHTFLVGKRPQVNLFGTAAISKNVGYNTLYFHTSENVDI